MKPTSRKPKGKQNRNIGPVPRKGIAVDGSCIGNPGPAEYRIVDIETGQELYRASVGTATNNIAEFIGLASAVFMFPDNTPIYSDSWIAINWVRRKETQSAYDYNKLLMEQCVSFLKEMEHKPNINKWHTKEWGEIPADFGNK